MEIKGSDSGPGRGVGSGWGWGWGRVLGEEERARRTRLMRRMRWKTEGFWEEE